MALENRRGSAEAGFNPGKAAFPGFPPDLELERGFPGYGGRRGASAADTDLFGRAGDSLSRAAGRAGEGAL